MVHFDSLQEKRVVLWQAVKQWASIEPVKRHLKNKSVKRQPRNEISIELGHVKNKNSNNFLLLQFLVQNFRGLHQNQVIHISN